jgi:hypothetical protein
MTAPESLPHGHTIRLMPAEEWHKLGPLFAASFPNSPDLPPAPPLSHCIVIEHGDDIKFAMFFRQEFHMEPICGKEGYARFFPQMVALMEATLLAEVGPLYYYCTASDTPEQIAREEALGRTVLTDYRPVIRKIG